MTQSTLHPLTISLHKQSKIFEIVYDDGKTFVTPNGRIIKLNMTNES